MTGARRTLRDRVRGPWGWVIGFALLAGISGVFRWQRELLVRRQAPIALTLLLVVLFGGVMAGRRLGLALAVGGFFVLNYFFQTPYDHIAVDDPADWLVLISYLLVADGASRLLARERRQAEEARRRAREVQRLADLGAESLAAGRADAALESISDVIAQTLQLDRCEVWAIDAADGSLRRAALAPPALAEAERHAPPDARAEARARVAVGETAVGETGVGETGVGTTAVGDALAGAPRDAFVTLYVRRRPVGALRLVRADGLTLDESERTFVDALAHYTALGVERVRLVAEAARAEAVREADRLKDFVLASVSHDLRTPLTTIKALAHEGARRGDRHALAIEEQADRLSRMVADLLDLSRARAGGLPLAPEINTAEDVVGAALRQAGGVLHGRTVETRIRADGGALVGYFDFVATLRILGNLIDNAVKYAPAGTPILVDVVRAGPVIAFAVADRGAGIAAEERERVFVPFHRAPGAAPDVGSTGLGLAVARALAEGQNGSLSYEPRPDGGSIFTLRVPASDDALALRLLDEPADDVADFTDRAARA